MKYYKNVKSYSVTWLANTYDKNTSQGTIANYYLPETMEEFTELCRELYRKNEKFRFFVNLGGNISCQSVDTK